MSRVFVGNAPVPAGRTVSLRLWIPAGLPLSGVQPFVRQDATANWLFTGSWVPATSLKAGVWNTVTVQVPATAASPVYQLGLELFTSGAWSGTVYVDSVSW
jgi:hypothetical protein